MDFHAGTNLSRKFVGEIAGIVNRVGKFTDSLLISEVFKLLLQNVGLMLKHGDKSRVGSRG